MRDARQAAPPRRSWKPWTTALALVLLVSCGEPRAGADPPEARFTGRSSAPAGSTLLFDASESEDNGLLMFYEFDFGDGSRSVRSFSPIAEHTFIEAGEFTVTLTVEDDLGNPGEVRHNVLISDAYEPCQDPLDCDADSTCVDKECRIRTTRQAAEIGSR